MYIWFRKTVDKFIIDMIKKLDTQGTHNWKYIVTEEELIEFKLRKSTYHIFLNLNFYLGISREEMSKTKIS